MAKRVFHIALLAALAAGCGEDKPLSFEAGPLGAVEVDAGTAVQVRIMLPLTGLQNISESIQKAIELAVEDYGPIHGRAVALGQPVDTMCSSDGGSEGARQIVADPQVIGVIGPACSEASVGASPVLSAAGLSTISAGERVARSHVGPRGQPRTGLPSRLLSRVQQRPLSSPSSRPFRL